MSSPYTRYVPETHLPNGDERVEIWAQAASEALANENSVAIRLDSPAAPSCPGLYAIHASPSVWRELGLGSPPDERALYIGKAEKSLAGRDIQQHFGYCSEGRTTSITGYSTLRRSIAALLRDSMGFHAVPRNAANSGHYSNFGLAREDDALLSKWMRARLGLAHWAKPDDCEVDRLKSVEQKVFRRLLPPLNLRDVDTPWETQIEAARSVMAAEARRWKR
jgi:hypothetical protein